MFPRSIEKSSTSTNRPVFITGAPRCGSSWVGEILGASTGVRYIYEPFNKNWVPKLQGKLNHFAYVDTSSMVSGVIKHTANNAFQGKQSWKQLTRAAYRGYWSSAIRRASNVVVKDPTASLMSSWIAKQYDAQVLFIMRHPCGFASSLDALDWKLGVNCLLRQEALMQDHLEPYRALLQHASNDKWLTRGAIWGALHKVYSMQLPDNPDWLLYRYEDLCKEPVRMYTLIAGHLGLKLRHSATQQIHSLSTSDSNDPGSTRRNSTAMPAIWQQRMSAGEVDAVMGVVRDFELDYY